MPQHMPTACIATPFLTLHLALPRSTSHPQKEFEDASEEPLKKKNHTSEKWWPTALRIYLLQC